MSLIATTPGGNPQQLSGQLQYDRVLPEPLAADANNYAPRGFQNSSGIYLSATVPISLTGLSGGTDGRRVTLENIGVEVVTLSGNNVASDAANRFLFADFNIQPSTLVDIEWSSPLNGWILVATGSGGGGGGGGSRPIFTPNVAAALGANEDDFNPAGWNGADAVGRGSFAAAGGGSTITGLDSSAAVDGQAIVIVNSSDADTITLSDEDIGSAAANRFHCPGGGDFVLIQGSACIVMYDADISRWRILP